MSNHARRHEPVEIDPPVIERPSFWHRLSARLGMGRPAGPVCVAEITNRPEADVMVGYLRSHGINAHVLGDDVGGAAPYMQAAFGVRVLVAEGDADEARRLLADANE